ncbi:MAG: hypothetical protein QG608_512, partial [Actinomycetota bacterium]|nr:hypothetical protein [Actinomycetota bacterium]
LLPDEVGPAGVLTHRIRSRSSTVRDDLGAERPIRGSGLGHRNDFPWRRPSRTPLRDYRECMPTSAVPPSLRRAVLASCVLDDLDLHQAPWGVRLPGPDGADESGVHLEWSAIAQALAGHDPLSPVGRARVSCLLGPARLVADLGEGAPEALRESARLLALPPDHVLHPGPGWVRDRVLGGTLDVGVGFLDRSGARDRVRPVPPAVLAAAGVDPDGWWDDLTAHAEHMGSLIASRLEVLRRRRSALRPAGGCDVLTLLASRTLRTALARLDGTGLRAVAVPDRDRGWFDLSRIDPAFVASAWSATDETARGLARPVLVTEDEVVLARPGGHPEREAL